MRRSTSRVITSSFLTHMRRLYHLCALVTYASSLCITSARHFSFTRVVSMHHFCAQFLVHTRRLYTSLLRALTPSQHGLSRNRPLSRLRVAAPSQISSFMCGLVRTRQHSQARVDLQTCEKDCQTATYPSLCPKCNCLPWG